MVLRRDGHTINKKRTLRLWREEELRLAGVELLRAESPNQVCALDLQFDETADRR